jgi:peroxiredoxin (alkyl hydroperoxide reductase subunit C)
LSTRQHCHRRERINRRGERATFIIDPEGILRAMVYYPMSNGRSVDEFVRLVQAMQTPDKHEVATPESWKPGDKVIVPPAGHC